MNLKKLCLQGSLFIFEGVLCVLSLLFTVQWLTSPKLEYPFIVGLLGVAVYGTLIVGSFMLYSLNQILQQVLSKRPFADEVLLPLKKIHWSLAGLTVAFGFSLPFWYQVAQLEDAPGVMLIGLAVVAIPFACFIFFYIVEELFKSALNLQNENDLTI